MVLLVRPLLSFKRLKCAEDLYLYIFERRGMKRQQTLRRENKINVHVIDFPLACAGQCVCLWMMLLPWTASPCFAAASAFPPLWRSFVACPKNWIQGVGRWGGHGVYVGCVDCGCYGVGLTGQPTPALDSSASWLVFVRKCWSRTTGIEWPPSFIRQLAAPNSPLRRHDVKLYLCCLLWGGTEGHANRSCCPSHIMDLNKANFVNAFRGQIHSIIN